MPLNKYKAKIHSTVLSEGETRILYLWSWKYFKYIPYFASKINRTIIFESGLKIIKENREFPKTNITLLTKENINL